MSRYSRHIILSEIGQEGQEKLNQAKVLVIGAGGLGCPVLQYLTAAGIGTIGIVDFDHVELSNLQRQILFGSSVLGLNKAEAAKARLADLNGDITINAYPEKLTYQNAIDLFNLYDIVVDGTDNFETRYLINDASLITNTPLVFGAIYKFEGQISVFNYKNGPSYRCLFPTPPKAGTVPNCSDIGVLGVLPGIVGSMQANEVLKIVLGLDDVLSGQLLCYNALTAKTITLKVSKSETEIQQVLDRKNTFQNNTLQEACEINSDTVSIADITALDNIQYIDVRETHELPKVDGLAITYMPLSIIETQLDKIDTNKIQAVFCMSGIRSKKAVSILKQYDITNCHSIIEGAEAIQSHINQLKPNY